jgi:hypothetical protein
MNIGYEIFKILPYFKIDITDPKARKYGYKNRAMMNSTVFHRETDYQTLDYDTNYQLFPAYQPEPFTNPPPIFEFFGYKEFIQNRDILCNNLGFLIITQKFIEFLHGLDFYQYRLYPTRIYFIDHRAKRMTRKKDFVASDFEAIDDYYILQLINPISPLWTVDKVGGKTVNYINKDYFDKDLPPIIHQSSDGFFCTRKAYDVFSNIKLGKYFLETRRTVLDNNGLLSDTEYPQSDGTYAPLSAR